MRFVKEMHLSMESEFFERSNPFQVILYFLHKGGLPRLEGSHLLSPFGFIQSHCHCSVIQYKIMFKYNYIGGDFYSMIFLA